MAQRQQIENNYSLFPEEEQALKKKQNKPRVWHNVWKLWKDTTDRPTARDTELNCVIEGKFTKGGHRKESLKSQNYCR